MNIINEIKKQIEKYDVITVFGHVFPDGDCYGSQIGLKELLSLNYPNKKIYALGSGFKKMIPLVGEMDVIDDEIVSSSLAIVLDSSTFERVEDRRFLSAKEIVFIDHHVKTTTHPFSYVQEEAVSTCEIIANLSKKYNWKMNEEAATALMLGLITDGGRFLYTPTPEEFLVAQYLLDHKAKLEKIYDTLYETSEEDFAFKGYYYSHFKKARGYLYICFLKEELKEIGITSNKAATSVNLLSSCKGYPIWCAFAENEDGTIKAEFRCKREFEVASLAISHGGGGHPCASGCTLSSWEEVNLVLQEIEVMVNKNNEYNLELNAMIEAGIKAREKILEIYNTGFDVEIKEDNSPVTLADKCADKMISTYLKERFPKYAMLTEESIDDKKRLENEYCFIVDPVDGTKDFVAKNGEFATNIALCRNHEIVVGVVVIPVTGEIYYAIKNQGAYYKKDINSPSEKIHVSNKLDDLTLYISRFHATDKEMEQIKLFPQISKVEQHGSSLKACYIAHGKGEIHYRLSAGTKEWDTAAIQIIVEEAGGLFIKPDGTRYTYNREDVYNREGYIITNCEKNILLK